MWHLIRLTLFAIAVCISGSAADAASADDIKAVCLAQSIEDDEAYCGCFAAEMTRQPLEDQDFYVITAAETADDSAAPAPFLSEDRVSALDELFARIDATCRPGEADTPADAPQE